MEYQFFIGIDVSKKTLDCTILKAGDFLLHTQIENTKAGIQNWLKNIKAEHKAGGRKTLFCIEHGVTYDAFLVKELTQKKLSLWLETPLHIKRSLGMQRGKNDKIDSLRIAQFAYLHRKGARLWCPPREVILRLRQLRSIRDRLLQAIFLLEAHSKETNPFMKKGLQTTLTLHFSKSVTALKSDLATTTLSIKETIQGDEYLSHLHHWITSVSCIGNVIAVEMIILTDEFKKITSAKKFACYCGVVPFEYSSGTSNRGRARVSKIANRRMKSLLHMASMGIVRSKGELRDYYERKVAEGHNKMSVLNAVRNKLIHRVFACVRDQRPYKGVLNV